MSIYSTVDYLRAQGAKDGEARGLQEGQCRQAYKLLLRHGKRRFGPPDKAQQTVLETLVDRLAVAPLEQLQDRFLAVQTWTELLADVTLPEQPPGQPDYLQPFDFDPEPMPPSIDEYMRLGLKDGAGEMMLHLRFQRLYQEDLGVILHEDSQRLTQRFHCPVQTVVLVLWPGADGPALTGEYRPLSGGVYRYNVKRLWEMNPAETLHSCSTAIFAPLTRFPPEQLPAILQRMKDLITTQAKDEKTLVNLWGVTYCCMGLRYPAEQVNELLADVMPIVYRCPDTKGVLSDGYYMGRSKGETEGALQATERWVHTLGNQRLGEPPAAVRQIVTGLRDLQRLEQLAARILKVDAWPEVLALN
jgi:hypothetical protein